MSETKEFQKQSQRFIEEMGLDDCQCFHCRHFNGNGTCRAFPDEIPQEIMTGEHDHREPFAGDGGIFFEMADNSQ